MLAGASVGAADGDLEGAVVGLAHGADVGRAEGEPVGRFVAPSSVGELVMGTRVGLPDGINEGVPVGSAVGSAVGAADGTTVGLGVGCLIENPMFSIYTPSVGFDPAHGAIQTPASPPFSSGA